MALAFTGILDRLGVRYVTGGSFASSVHGQPRSTDDVDIVADLHSGNATALATALGADWYLSGDAIHDAIDRGASFTAIHLGTGVRVDVFVVGSDAFDAHRVATARAVVVGTAPDATLRVDTAEHTVLRKLEWFRRAGETSERQWRDVIGVLRTQGARIDREELVTWAARLGVSDLLRRALADAE